MPNTEYFWFYCCTTSSNKNYKNYLQLGGLNHKPPQTFYYEICNNLFCSFCIKYNCKCTDKNKKTNNSSNETCQRGLRYDEKW